MIPIEPFTFNKERNFKEIFADAYLFIQMYGKEFFTIIVFYAAPLFVLSAYFASKANIQIFETKELFSSPYLWYSLLADFFADVIVNGLTFGSIIIYSKTGSVQRDDVMMFFNQNILRILGITIVANLIISLGFMMFIIPGIIILVPMSLFVFDRILNNESFEISFMRSVLLARSNFQLSYGVLFIMYAGIFGIKFLFESFMSVESEQYILLNTVMQTIMQIVFTSSSVIIALLYFTLFSKQIHRDTNK